MSAKQFLSPAAVITIRETTPHMLRTMSFMDVARVFGAVYSVSNEVVRRCLQGENYADTAYIPPTTTLRCPRCGIRRKWCAYFYGGTEDKHDVCWRCNKKHLRRERLRAGANKQNATDRKKWRDPVEDEKHRCQVCGMGVNMRGRAFQSQHEADQCCAGTVPIYRHSVLQTRGRFVTLSDYI